MTDEYTGYVCPRCGRQVTVYSCGMCSPVEYECGCAVWWDDPERGPYIERCATHSEQPEERRAGDGQ